MLIKLMMLAPSGNIIVGLAPQSEIRRDTRHVAKLQTRG
jgi:hypothetical protein